MVRLHSQGQAQRSPFQCTRGTGFAGPLGAPPWGV